jgi:hypothetical protein
MYILWPLWGYYQPYGRRGCSIDLSLFLPAPAIWFVDHWFRADVAIPDTRFVAGVHGLMQRLGVLRHLVLKCLIFICTYIYTV